MKNFFCIISILSLSIILVFTTSCKKWSLSGDVKKIVIMLDTPINKEDGHAQIQEKFKQLTGIELEIIKPPHNQYNDKLKLTFASGDVPDACEIQPQEYLAYATEGALADLTDLIRNSKIMRENVPQKYIDQYRLKSDGKVYGVPLNTGGGCVNYIRQDWLDALKLNVPTNWNEFVDVIKAFAENDPDGDNKQNTFGYTTVMNEDFDKYNRQIFHDAYFDFINKNGKWVDGFTEPEMQGALERFRQLYADKIIDTEFFTNKTSSARDKFTQGIVGDYEYWAGEWGFTLDERAKRTKASSKIVATEPIKETQYLNRVAPAIVITAKAKNPKAVFNAFIEGLYDKSDRQILWTYGVEDVHWTKKTNPPSFLPTLSDPSIMIKKTYIARDLQVSNLPYMIPIDSRITDSLKKFENAKILPLVPGGKFYFKNMGEILALRQEIASKIISGKYTFEEGMNIYKDKMKALDIDGIIQELNQ